MDFQVVPLIRGIVGLKLGLSGVTYTLYCVFSFPYRDLNLTFN